MNGMLSPIWILSTPRTGSSLLAEYLNQTDLFEPQFREHLSRWNGDAFSFPRYNKCFPHQLKKAYHHINFDLVEKEYPTIKWIKLVREDIIAQTVSLFVANETTIWNTKQAKLKDRRDRMRLHYDARKVEEHYLWLKKWRSCVESTFRARDCFSMTYESFISSQKETLEELFRYLLIEYSVESLVPQTMKLEHPQTKEFIHKARVDLKGL